MQNEQQKQQQRQWRQAEQEQQQLAVQKSIRHLIVLVEQRHPCIGRRRLRRHNQPVGHARAQVRQGDRSGRLQALSGSAHVHTTGHQRLHRQRLPAHSSSVENVREAAASALRHLQAAGAQRRAAVRQRDRSICAAQLRLVVVDTVTIRS